MYRVKVLTLLSLSLARDNLVCWEFFIICSAVHCINVIENSCLIPLLIGWNGLRRIKSQRHKYSDVECGGRWQQSYLGECWDEVGVFLCKVESLPLLSVSNRPSREKSEKSKIEAFRMCQWWTLSLNWISANSASELLIPSFEYKVKKYVLFVSCPCGGVCPCH